MGDIWNAIPLCIMWVIWKERNNWIFKGLEQSMVDVKLNFLCTLYALITTLSDHSFSSL